MMTLVKEQYFSTGENKQHYIHGTSKHCLWENSTLIKNLFLLPSSKAGRFYVKELTWLLNVWTNLLTMKGIKFNATMLTSCLLLRKPTKTSIDKYHSLVLKGTVMLIEKALINDPLRVPKYPENFTFQLLCY